MKDGWKERYAHTGASVKVRVLFREARSHASSAIDRRAGPRVFQSAGSDIARRDRAKSRVASFAVAQLRHRRRAPGKTRLIYKARVAKTAMRAESRARSSDSSSVTRMTI